MRKSTLVLSLAFAAIACGGSDATLEAHFDTSDGWHDLVIPIASHSREPTGKYSVVAAGELSGRQIGLRLLLDPSIRPGIVNDEIDQSAFFRDGMIIEALERSTESLVESLAVAYQVSRPEARLRQSIPLTVFALQGDPRQIESQPLKFKVFHGDTEERDQYYELFVHIDVPGGRVEIHEKDPEYRSSVIRGFFE